MMMSTAAFPRYGKYNHDLLSLRTHMLGTLPLAQPVEIQYHTPSVDTCYSEAISLQAASGTNQRE